MATDVGGTRPLTQFVAGNGRSAVSYTLPAGLYQYIQSVVATIDTTAAGAVSPLLTVYDDAGIVVADKQQGQAIDAGGAGRATWALRLTDEQATLADRRAYARFVGSELAAGATKVLVPAIAGTIIIPLDWYVVPSLNYSPSGGQPDLNLESTAFNWDFTNVNSFGVTYYNTATIYTSAPSTNGIPLSIAGDPLQVTAVPNGATSAVGHIEVFVRYYTVRVRP